jgi:tetratricopeptide (TPR) repeat protein
MARPYTRTRLQSFPLVGVISTVFAIVLVIACGNPEKEKVKHYRKGSILAQRGRYTEAVEEYQKALRIDPNMSEVHFELGRCYGNLEFHDRAIRALDAARTLDSQLTVAALIQIANIYSAGGQSTLAEKMCHDALEIDPNNVDIMTLLGRLTWNEDNANEARTWFEKILTMKPDHVESLLALAEIAMQAGRYDEAETYLIRITTEIDPNHVGAKLALAKVYRFSNRKDETIKTLRQILADNPDNIPARGALAEAYLAADRLDEARKQAEAFLKASPASTQAHFLVGAISIKQSDYESAVIHLTKAANSPTASAEIYYLLGLALKGTDNPAQAISALQKALTMKPDNAPCRLLLAQILLMEGAFDKAQNEITTVLSREPENEYAQQLWVQATAMLQTIEHLDSLLASEGMQGESAEKMKAALGALRVGNLPLVQSLCEDLIESAADSPIPLNLLGLVCLKQNELEQALAYFQKALSINPLFAPSYVNMANIYMAIGNHEQSVWTYRKAVELAPKDKAIKLRFVKALTLMNRYGEAEVFLKKLIQQNPDELSYCLILANLLVSTNRYSDAREMLDQILKVDPRQTNAKVLLAETLAREGRLAEAAASLERLQSAYPDSGYFQGKLSLCNLALGLPEKAWEVLSVYAEADKKTISGELARTLIMQKQGQYDDAERVLVELRSSAPMEAAFELMLANIRAVGGNSKVAEGFIDQDSRLSDAFRKGYLQLLQGNSLEANDLYEFNLGIALSHVQWHLLGIKKLENIAQKADSNAALFELIGGLWEREGGSGKGQLSYQLAIAADSSYWPAHYRLGLQALHTGQTEQAEHYFHSALRYQPDSLAILLGLARLYEANGNATAALKTYQKLNSLYPNIPPIMNNLAWLLALNPEELDEALEYARLAVAAQPVNANALDTLGWLFFQKGDYESAREQLDRAVLFNSLNPSIRYHRGMTYFKLGDKTAAMENFGAAKSALTPFPEKQLTEKMIRELS